MSHHRGEQIKRQWRILKALNDCNWWTLWEIMDAAKIEDRHKRTVMRDMDALMEVFPVHRRQGDRTISAGGVVGAGHHYEYRLAKPLWGK